MTSIGAVGISVVSLSHSGKYVGDLTKRISGQFSTLVFSCLRVFALWSRNQTVLWLILIPALVSFGLALVGVRHLGHAIPEYDILFCSTRTGYISVAYI